MDIELQKQVDSLLRILDNITDDTILKSCYKCCLRVLHPNTSIKYMNHMFSKIKRTPCYQNSHIKTFFQQLQNLLLSLDDNKKRRFLYHFNKNIKFYLENRNLVRKPKTPLLGDIRKYEYLPEFEKQEKQLFNGKIFEYMDPDVRLFMDDDERRRMKIKFNIYEDSVEDYHVHDYDFGDYKSIRFNSSRNTGNTERKKPTFDNIDPFPNFPKETEPSENIGSIPVDIKKEQPFKLNEQYMNSLNSKERSEYLIKYIEKTLTSRYEKEIVYFISRLYQRFKKFGKNVIYLVKGGHATRLYLEYLSRLLKKDLKYLQPDTSDWDTGIYINPELKSNEWNKILDEVNSIVKDEIDTFNKNFTSTQKDTLKSINDKYFRVITDDSVRIELLTSNMCQNRQCEKIKKGCKCVQKIPYVFSESYNYTIPSDFILHRIKFNVQILNNMRRISTECIDISIEKENSMNLRKLWIDRFKILHRPVLILISHGYEIPIPSLEYLNMEEQSMINELESAGPNHPGYRKLKKRKERVKKLNEAMCYFEGTVFDGKKLNDYNQLESKCASNNINISKCNINSTVNEWINKTTNMKDITKNQIINLILKLVSNVTEIYFGDEFIARNILFSFRKTQLCSILIWYFKILYHYLTEEQMAEYLNVRFTQNNNTKYDYLVEVEIYLVSLIDDIDLNLKEGILLLDDDINKWREEHRDRLLTYFLHRMFGICIKKRIQLQLENTLRDIERHLDKNIVMFIIGGESVKLHYPGLFETPDYDIEVIHEISTSKSNITKTILYIHERLETLTDELNKNFKFKCFIDVTHTRYKARVFQQHYGVKIVFYANYKYTLKNVTHEGKANLFEIKVFTHDNNGLQIAVRKYNNDKMVPFEVVKNKNIVNKNGLGYASISALQSEFDFRKGKRGNTIKDYIDMIRGRLIKRIKTQAGGNDDNDEIVQPMNVEDRETEVNVVVNTDVNQQIKNVFHLTIDELDQYPNIKSRIDTLINDCGFSYSDCSGYDTCKSYSVICIDKEMLIGNLNTSLHDMLENANEKTNFLKHLNDYPEYIVGYAKLVQISENSDSAEIYDVCVSNNDRKKGYSNDLFNYILKYTDKNKLWLGIELENPLFNMVIRLYAKYGFKSPMVTQHTSFGKEIGFLVIGLTWIRGESFNYTETIKNAIELRNINSNICMYPIHIHETVLTKLRSYLDKDVEYAGQLLIDRFIEKDGIRYGNLVYPTRTEIKGTNVGENGQLFYNTPLPKSYISFHTHPDICYQTLGCYIGWPSGQDIANIVDAYPRPTIHFVIAKEGIYSIKFNIKFLKIAEYIPQRCRSLLFKAIKDRFDHIDPYRSVIHRNRNRRSREEQIKIFIEHSNGFSLSDISSSLRGTGCLNNVSLTTKIFNIKYLDWENAEQRYIDDMLYTKITNPKCPNIYSSEFNPLEDSLYIHENQSHQAFTYTEEYIGKAENWVDPN